MKKRTEGCHRLEEGAKGHINHTVSVAYKLHTGPLKHPEQEHSLCSPPNVELQLPSAAAILAGGDKSSEEIRFGKFVFYLRRRKALLHIKGAEIIVIIHSKIVPRQ